ncbi:hypothetical protein [Mucilaginibacter aquaedulcis]|uniref:hypothetical protein n=1 Tax=Mucilaginibacter aquaedulcis TaxID=1187081 RepID=UPI0025B3F693|nr:hypothetical protein [Mucilaginibacter aquaedulcis]MDN3548631.1 hypothetical protein [Mucilaginibacter aquaedulcis]
MKPNDNYFISQLNIFFAMLQEIEEEHWYWFNSRHGINQTQEHDLIINHIALHYTDGETTVIFKIPENSELPMNIRAECHLAYDWIFGVN